MNDLIKTEVDRRGLVTQMATLSHQKAFYQRQATILPGLEQQQRELGRKLSAAESTYEALLKSLQQLKVKENETVANVRIVEAAQVPGEPIAPDKIAAIAAGGLAGILLAAAVVYILELSDKKIKTIIEARKLFEYNLLGTIPVFSKTTTTVEANGQTSEQRKLLLPMIQNPCSPISESYRRLQANLKFVNSDQPLKVIVVTSAVPKEGKSTTCANLAVAMAELGHKTLIIDADMRCPSQHKFWQISNTVGLSNVIAGQDDLSGTLIHSVMKNLDVLTSGSLPPNQVVLLDSQRLTALIEECRHQYDSVFIDTPPLAIAADAPILGKMADGVLLVTRPGIADFTSSKSAKEYLEQSGQNVLGLVVNAVIPENEASSYFYYYSAEYNQKLDSKELASHR
jgi:capsular exopolysaccharide synthesis family protein